MKLLFFDTETTGLPKFCAPATAFPNNYPDIVSIAWCVCTHDQTVLSKEYYLVIPEWDIPQGSIDVHGITEQMATHGRTLKYVVEAFLRAFNEADVIVGHNVEFDVNVLHNALKWRLHMPQRLKKRQFCTMVFSRIEGKKQFTLEELYMSLFGTLPEGTHNAEHDTQITQACFFKAWGHLLAKNG